MGKKTLKSRQQGHLLYKYDHIKLYRVHPALVVVEHTTFMCDIGIDCIDKPNYYTMAVTMTLVFRKQKLFNKSQIDVLRNMINM